MAPHATEPQSGRETRLLILVVGVAVAVLLLLAQWQFPGSVMTPSAAPLAGLAARATFDEMANTMADVIGRVSPLTVVVPLDPVALEEEAAPRVGVKPPPAAAEGDQVPETPAEIPPAGWALALRVRSDLALVHVPTGMTPRTGPDSSIDIAAHDPLREMMLLRVAESNAVPDTLSASIRTLPAFAYVAMVSATPVGPTVQPVFVGRADSVSDPRWSHALVPAAVAPGLTPGAVVFSLNSRLVGMVVDNPDGPMIVPAPALETLVQALETPGSPAE